jgi:tetratricopeptide (TPR) repeat protein
VNAYYNLGCILGIQKKYKEAISCYEKYLDIDPYDDECYLNIG